MFFKIINLFVLALTSICFANSNETIGNKEFTNDALEIDNSGLYDQDILELYNSTININDLYLRDTFQTYYFSNLADNIGNNTKGSCGFVAVGMILSFYDTYWDDSTIPETYDSPCELFSESILQSTSSPGIVMEPNSIAYANQQTYYSNISINGESYFHFKLMDLYKTNISDFPYDSEKMAYSYGLGYNDYYNLFHYYLANYLGLPNSAYTIHRTTNSVRSEAIKLVKRGIPVRLSIRDSEEEHGNHCVVAYDYDSVTDSLFCNFGWGANSTHVTIEQMEYEDYASLTAIELKTSHSHSNNYFLLDENNNEVSKCSCSTVIPTEICVLNDYLDTVPTFKWNSLIKEKWFQSIGLHHEFSILRSNHYEVFTIEDIYDNKVTLNSSNWETTFNIATPRYYAYVGLASDIDPYWDDYYCLQLFREPNRYLNKSSFLPSDWGLSARYYFSNELDSYHLSIEPERKYTTATINSLTITTDRLRCGYIEQSYVVLSPRRENAGRAYFEMNFNTAVYSFMYRACMWSSSENLDGIAIIQTKNSSGVWTTLKDIPISSLPTKANGVAQFVEQTSQGIYGLRFETTATATGTRNKGRLCLDDIVFSTQSGTPNNSYTSFDYSTKN